MYLIGGDIQRVVIATLEGKSKTVLDLFFDERRCALEKPSRIFLEDCSMVFTTNSAAVEEHSDQRLQLGISITGIVNMLGCLRGKLDK